MVKETKFYDLLGVSPNTSKADITKAYRRLALQHHPDKGGNQDKFKEITNAYSILSDDTKRNSYDMFGECGIDQSSGINPDILQGLFKGMMGGGLGNIFGGLFRGNTGPQKSKPLIYTCSVDLEHLCTRKIKTLNVSRNIMCICQQNTNNCRECNGSGRVSRIRQLGPAMVQQIIDMCSECKGTGKERENCGECKEGIVSNIKKFLLHLTPEVENGFKYVFHGEGNQDIGCTQGDFIVVIDIKKHPIFTKNGLSLYISRKILLKEALCGCSFELKHPNSENMTITITNVINPELEMIYPGLGMNSEGDLKIKFDITFPDTLTNQQKGVLNKLL